MEEQGLHMVWVRRGGQGGCCVVLGAALGGIQRRRLRRCVCF